MMLFFTSFSFTYSWKVFITEKRGVGIRAQMLMLSVAVLLFFPTIKISSLSGNELMGDIAPVGISLLVGAFLFGVGMQLAGGCASGTLFTVGGGNIRMLITLLFFIIGSLIGTAHFSWWMVLPSLPPLSLTKHLGVIGGIIISLLLFLIIALFTIVLEKNRYENLEEITTKKHLLYVGAVFLALLNFVTLIIAGKPWGVTSAFALWGAKIFEFFGGSVHSWGYWQIPNNAIALENSIFKDTTTLMNIGIITGASIAATLKGKFIPKLNITIKSAFTAVIGGLLMGYGARLAFGCNIGAYFSGIASGSLHGWLWFVAAFAGNLLVIKIYSYVVLLKSGRFNKC